MRCTFIVHVLSNCTINVWSTTMWLYIYCILSNKLYNTCMIRCHRVIHLLYISTTHVWTIYNLLYMYHTFLKQLYNEFTMYCIFVLNLCTDYILIVQCIVHFIHNCFTLCMATEYYIVEGFWNCMILFDLSCNLENVSVTPQTYRIFPNRIW